MGFLVIVNVCQCECEFSHREFTTGTSTLRSKGDQNSYNHSNSMTPGMSFNSPKVFSLEYNTYKKPSSSLCSAYMELNEAAVGGNMSLTKMKIALSAGTSILLLITYTNWPMVKSYGTKYFFLSISGKLDFSARSQMIGIRFLNLERILSASDLLFSDELC